MTTSTLQHTTRAQDAPPAMHVGRAIAASLELHGVQRVFSVPGESYLALLDGLHDVAIPNVVCRHEGGAAYMAEATGKLTGTPGVAMVTRGPGAANAFVAVHVAWQDASPMVLFVGLIPVADRGRDAFQEFDPNGWFGSQAKRVLVLDAPERASEVVAEAFRIARSGRPGPVIVGLPEDVVAAPFTGELRARLPVARGAVADDDREAILDALAGAERPLLLVGGEGWTPEAAKAVQGFAERNRLPVLQEWHATGRIPTDSPSFVGQLAFGGPPEGMRMLEDADVLVTVGAVLNDVTTGSYVARQNADARTIVVSLDPELRGGSGALSRHVLASPETFAKAIADAALPEHARRSAWTAQHHDRVVAERLDWSARADGRRGASMTRLIDAVAERLRDPLVTVGAGNHSAWAQLLPSVRYPAELATRNGSMGYSVPAALAAALEDPNREVVTIVGDGELLMNGQELATAAQEGAAFLVIAMDNGQYGTIRSHQERYYPGRVSGTQLTNPDFAALARAYGGHGETVRADGEIDGAVTRALAAVEEGRCALIHIVVDPDILLP